MRIAILGLCAGAAAWLTLALSPSAVWLLLPTTALAILCGSYGWRHLTGKIAYVSGMAIAAIVGTLFLLTRYMLDFSLD